MENVGSIKFNTPELWQALCNACSSPPSSPLIQMSNEEEISPTTPLIPFDASAMAYSQDHEVLKNTNLQIADELKVLDQKVHELVLRAPGTINLLQGGATPSAEAKSSESPFDNFNHTFPKVHPPKPMIGVQAPQDGSSFYKVNWIREGNTQPCPSMLRKEDGKLIREMKNRYQFDMQSAYYFVFPPTSLKIDANAHVWVYKYGNDKVLPVNVSKIHAIAEKNTFIFYLDIEKDRYAGFFKERGAWSTKAGVQLILKNGNVVYFSQPFDVWIPAEVHKARKKAQEALFATKCIFFNLAEQSFASHTYTSIPPGSASYTSPQGGATLQSTEVSEVRVNTTTSSTYPPQVTSQSHTSTPEPRTHAPFSPEWERFNGIRGINSENFREVLLKKMNARNSTRASTKNSGTDH